MAKLSQYEIEREANIARNKALLEQLELKQAVEGLGFPAKPVPATKAKPIQPAKRTPRQSEVEGPRRQSARLRGGPVDPDETPAKKRKREAERHKQLAREAEERIEAEEQQRIAKRPRHHDLDMEALAEAEDAKGLSEEFQSIPGVSRRVGDPEAFAFDSDQRDQRCVEELREKLQNLKVVSRAKVTNDRVYSAAYHPEVTKDLIFFGDKHGQLGVWDAQAPPEEVQDEDGDVSTDDREGGKYWRLQVHWPATSKSSISSIKVDPLNANNLYTSSYDGTIRSLSFTTGVSTEVFAAEDTLLCSIDLTPTGQEMWISDALGGLTHLDLRQRKSQAKWFNLSSVKIGCVSVNPTRPHFLLTASNDRSLKIWDIRKLESISGAQASTSSPGPGDDEAPPPIEYDADIVTRFLDSPKGKGCLRSEWRHEKSVSSAYWDPRGRSIVSTSYDDTLRLWDIDSSRFESKTAFPSSRPFSMLKHNCQTGKWLSVFKAQWSTNPDYYPPFHGSSGLSIGNMTHSLDIYSGKGDLIAKLSDKSRITAVQAVTCSHPNVLERAVSGNASGRCVLWAPSEAQEE
ncbi:WD40-repeat-containing domain protein [Mycena floridula]|nr:WD40-repeat-containing domain protein [Mycena floridula]